MGRACRRPQNRLDPGHVCAASGGVYGLHLFCAGADGGDGRRAEQEKGRGCVPRLRAARPSGISGAAQTSEIHAGYRPSGMSCASPLYEPSRSRANGVCEGKAAFGHGALPLAARHGISVYAPDPLRAGGY